MKEIPSVETISDYFKVIDSCQRYLGGFSLTHQGSFLFRGESEKFQLPCHSSLSRYLHEDIQRSQSTNSATLELFSLHDWIVHSELAERKAYPKNNWEQLMLARHHGLKTRLTDWTFNPLTALWFSCDPDNNEFDSDGRVFMCKARTYGINQLIDAPIKDEQESYRVEYQDGNIEELGSLFVLPPNNFNERIFRQAGVFHSSCDSTKSALDFSEDNIEICIPARAKPQLICSLNACNINKHTLGLSTPDNIAFSENKRWFK